MFVIRALVEAGYFTTFLYYSYRPEDEKKVKERIPTCPDRHVETEDLHGQVSRIRARYKYI